MTNIETASDPDLYRDFTPTVVMARPVPAIHVLAQARKVVDGRAKARSAASRFGPSMTNLDAVRHFNPCGNSSGVTAPGEDLFQTQGVTRICEARQDHDEPCKR
jgi:hypothetical protein